MTYSPPSIGTQGLSIPGYADIKAALLADFIAAYPVTSYLDIDAADLQWVSSVALKIADTVNGLQLIYNGRSPATAIGSDLDAMGRIVGVFRKPATFSAVPLVAGGTPGTPITNGSATGEDGTVWNFPPNLTIGGGGTVSFTGTAAQPGAVQAVANSITNKGAGATAGWLTITNPSAASPGVPVESDSQYRARMALSVALPSRTTLQGTIAGIAAVPSVTRYNVLENPTGAVDGFGNPPHSLSAVVEGGTDLAVATAIYANRGIGCFTNGTTTVTVSDPNNPGFAMPISFFRPNFTPIYVALQLHGLSAGFTTATQTAVKAAVAAYINSLQIGETLTISALYAAALSVTPNLSLPLFSIRGLAAGTAPAPVGTVDLTALFYEVFSGLAVNVSITLV